MDANAYETFEYLQPNNSENVSEQLFVVEDNGTFLTLNRPVDLVNQVQNVEVLEDVQPGYAVAPEQFYIDVDGTSELITVAEPFALSNQLQSEDNNIYANNFMLQQVADTSTIRVQQTVGKIADNVVEQFIKKDSNASVDANVNMDTDSTPTTCTEITITDEQYKLLEQKGWTMIESNGNVFLIDTLGLHDITHDDQLIQKLKLEMTNCVDPQYTEADTSNIILETENIVPFNESFENNVLSEQDSIPFIQEDRNQIDLNSMEVQTYPSVEEVVENATESNPAEVPDLMPLEKEFLETTVNELSEKYEKSDPRINSNTIKIKTKFSLKDIPQEILLGRTVNGKKLVARVTKTDGPEVDSGETDTTAEKRKPKVYPTNAFHQKIERLIQQAIRGGLSQLSEEEVSAGADRVVQQLLRVPAFKPAVIERRLIITKIVIMEDKDQNSIEERDPIIITGRVVKKGDNSWGFQYIPDMLQKIRDNRAELKGTTKKNAKPGDVDATFLQIHIQEVNSPDGIARISITLNRRVILLKSKKMVERPEAKAAKLKRVYACSTCAAVFNTEYRLRLHQQLHKVSDNLKTNTVKAEKMYQPTMIAGTKKGFICNQCEFQTIRQSVMNRHIKSHFNLLLNKVGQSEGESNDTDEVTVGKYKCNMCSISYINAATLSKHIVTKHVKVP